MWLYLQRALIDGLRVLLPGYIVGGLAILSMLVVLTAYEEYGAWGAYTAIPLLAWAAFSLCVLAVVVLKWLIMGEVRPVVVPLWSRYVWRNELVNGLYECLMARWSLTSSGRRLLHAFKAAWLQDRPVLLYRDGIVSEFDLVEIGDHVALNAGAVMQNHLFEDRVMKSSAVKVGHRCTVGNMSVVLYDTQMEPGAVLGPLSLLMMGETMPEGCRWHGIPTVQA